MTLPPTREPSRMTEPSTPSGPPKMPRWVKISGIIVLLLLLVLVIVMATGIGGEHGPMRHAGSGGATPSTISTAGSESPTGMIADLEYTCHEPGHYDSVRGQITIA